MNPRVQPIAAFEEQLRRALRLYPPDARYLVGVSGGRDSVALLYGLVALGYRRLVVCHLDHALRGRASRGDARFVERLAAELDLKAEMGRTEVRALARKQKLSVETAAREARYEFFAAVAARRRCRVLFLAHQADDQAETFLFNLLRGSGPAGLAGMAMESERDIGGRRLRMARPLLGVWREEIDAYLGARRLKWRDDATNADPLHGTRNRLRSEVLPMLERAMGRDVKRALWRAADLLSAENAWVSGLLEAEMPLPARLPLSVLEGRPLAKQRRLLRAWLGACKATGIGYEEVESVRSLLDVADGPAKVNLRGGLHARRRGGVLFVE